MSHDPALLDTNVLIDALYEDSEHYPAARALLDQAQHGDANFHITPQVVAEFYAVVTHPKRVTIPKSPEEALTAIESFLALPGLSLLPTPPDIVSRLSALVRKYPTHIIHRKIFDAQLVAAMLPYGVRKIFTFNVSDFLPFSEIEVKEPEEP